MLPKISSVSLKSRKEANFGGLDLLSVHGAQQIISEISKRRIVEKLLLGHNKLGDDGIEAVFDYLSSEPAARHKITSVAVNSNIFGNKGLGSIARYLASNGKDSLQELFLQNNNFTLSSSPSSIPTSAFVEALNNSRVVTLCLSTNPQLAQDVATTFLPCLNAPRLRELQLSAVGLTPQAAPAIIEYISHPRCRLETLKCSGNMLGYRAVDRIVRTLERGGNWKITRLEVYSNSLDATATLEEEDVEDDISGDDNILPSYDPKQLESRLSKVLQRNMYRRKEVSGEALRLLLPARVLLLKPVRHSQLPTPPASPAPSSPSFMISNHTLAPSSRQCGWSSLPLELQQCILSLLAPLLSDTQRLAVFAYASSPKTLPPLLPVLTSTDHTCIPDPMASPSVFYAVPGSGLVPPMAPWPVVGLAASLGGGGGGCASGHCMGSGNSLTCRRERERRTWLEVVGCDVYEP